YVFVFDNGSFVDPSSSGEILVKVPLIDNSGENEIAGILRDIVDEQTDFDASGSGDTVLVTNSLDGSSLTGEDVDTGFTFSQSFSGAKAKVYARFFGSEIEQGETRQVSDNENYELINYIGARSETDFSPIYSSAFEQITVLSFILSIPAASSIASGESFRVLSANDNESYRFRYNKDGVGG